MLKIKYFLLEGSCFILSYRARGVPNCFLTSFLVSVREVLIGGIYTVFCANLVQQILRAAVLDSEDIAMH